MGALAVRAAPPGQASVISPAYVETPTPTPRVVVLPTPTSTPQSLSVVALDGVGTYAVRPGDTLLSVALEIGLDLEEMNCVVTPDFTWDRPLVIGDVLDVPSAGSACHEVQAGETLAAIAARHDVAESDIYAVAWNGLQGQPLSAVDLIPGTHLRIPGKPHAQSDSTWLDVLNRPLGAQQPALMAVGGPREAPAPAPVPKDWPYGSGYFAWPTYGWLSQGFEVGHRAVDIAAPAGTLVAAADRGVVVRAGWNEQGYGNFVVIDHNIDYISLYAHLDRSFVEEGQIVGQGDLLGTVGSTGYATGSHLHFEIRDFGSRVDPIPLLLR